MFKIKLAVFAIIINMLLCAAPIHAKQDPHHIRVRHSLIAKTQKVDLLICFVAGVEMGCKQLGRMSGLTLSVI